MKEILAEIKEGDWVCCDRAQPDLRCRMVTKRTPKRVWTGQRDPYRLDGRRYKGDEYPVRPATEKDLLAWEEAKEATRCREEKANQERLEQDRINTIRDAAEELLAALKDLREWHRSEYQSNHVIDAKVDAAIAKAEGRE